MPNKSASIVIDVFKSSRQELIRTNIIHEFDDDRVRKSLIGCYGQLMESVYRRVLGHVTGSMILDCGCGFGQFARIAIDSGYIVHPIDIDEVSLAIAKEVMKVPARNESVYSTALPDNSVDTSVCFDSIQHLDIAQLATEFDRLGVRRVIVYDSNPRNRFLRAYRSMVGHEENNERSVEDILEDFGSHGFTPVMISYENYAALPISGGFQQPPVPVLSWSPKTLYRFDNVIALIMRFFRIDKFFAFRFLMVLDRKASND